MIVGANLTQCLPCNTLVNFQHNICHRRHCTELGWTCDETHATCCDFIALVNTDMSCIVLVDSSGQLRVIRLDQDISAVPFQAHMCTIHLEM